MGEARACGSLEILFVSADGDRALAVALSRERAQALTGRTDLALADLDATLLSGSSLEGAGCTDLPGEVRVNAREPVVRGTLSITIEGGRADFTLRDAATEKSEVEDAAFSDVFVAGSPG